MEDNARNDRHLAFQINSLEWQVHNKQLEDSIEEHAARDHQYQIRRSILDNRLVAIIAHSDKDGAEYHNGKGKQDDEIL